MNYTDPSYPAYPPQYYKDPKNALWFVLGGAFMIFCAVMWDVVYVMLYGSVLHRLLSQAYMADGIRLIEQLVLVAFGICCIVFHENRRVLAYFCMVLACFNLFLVTWCLVSGGYTVSAYLAYGAIALIWAFTAALILLNVRRPGRRVALLVPALLVVLFFLAIFIIEGSVIVYDTLLRHEALDLGDSMLFLYYPLLSIAQGFVIVAAFIPNKASVRMTIPNPSNAPFENRTKVPFGTPDSTDISNAARPFSGTNG